MKGKLVALMVLIAGVGLGQMQVVKADSCDTCCPSLFGCCNDCGDDCGCTDCCCN